MACTRDSTLRQIHNRAGMVTPDGMPLVWVGRWYRRKMERVCGPDLLPAICAASRGWTHYLYGGGPGVPELLAQRLTDRHRGLTIAGAYSPPFRELSPEEDEDIVRRINDANPDIVWVGLGTPKQEQWMASHRARLNAPVLVGVGAAFDFHAGVKRQAPRWLRHSGFEWCFRLATEPRRLWKRYLRNNPLFVYQLALQLIGDRRQP
jgi:N-acetylglucosaminyldiphosphoundecaprenol N-acetyl-beta-D-mannosaminyltransferase